MYGKIFDSMYEGTLYGHWEAIATLQQMLVLCNKDGVVEMTPQAIAARTSFPFDVIQKGIKVLSEPDPYSRTPGEEGRRIVLLDPSRPWGWRLVNYAKYQQIKNRQEKLEADRIRIADKRKANKSKDVAGSRKTSQSVADVAPVTPSVSGTGTASLKVKSTPAARATPARQRKSPLPPDFWISDRVKAWASEKGFDRLAEHLEAFKRKCAAGGYAYVDHDSAFMDAIREDWAKLRGAGRQGVASPPVADGKITCETCGIRVSSYTGRQCDPCWRGGIRAIARTA